jgi:hypothetical protein
MVCQPSPCESGRGQQHPHQPNSAGGTNSRTASRCAHRTRPIRTSSLRAICCPACYERRHCESCDTSLATIAHRRYSQTSFRNSHSPSPLLTEVIYEEELVCIVAADAPYQRQLTLKRYLAAEHIGVDVVEGLQHIPEKRLAAHGHRRRTVITLPYFGAATLHPRNQTDSYRTTAIRSAGGGKSQNQSAEGAERNNRLQVSDDLASASQYGCRA